jgi:DNA-binding CsgD family transcriptional regulator
VQPRYDSGSIVPSLARLRDTGLSSLGMVHPTARLYPSALSDGGWYVMTTDAPASCTVYSPPPTHLLSILEELLTGDTDVTMSRRLNMSPRTFSRRVAELLEYLGVSTRFQAGMEIAARGWIPLTAYAPSIKEPPRRSQAGWR